MVVRSVEDRAAAAVENAAAGVDEGTVDAGRWCLKSACPRAPTEVGALGRAMAGKMREARPRVAKRRLATGHREEGQQCGPPVRLLRPLFAGPVAAVLAEHPPGGIAQADVVGIAGLVAVKSDSFWQFR